jgi:hypothetical protein
MKYKNVDYAGIDDEAAKEIGLGLKSNTSLTFLSLSKLMHLQVESNCIGTEGANEIGHNLKDNHTLEGLNLSKSLHFED